MTATYLIHETQYHTSTARQFNILNIFLLVLLSDKDVSTSWFEFMALQLPKSLIVHRKVHLQTTFLNIVLPATH